jgi:hypothetical protein
VAAPHTPAEREANTVDHLDGLSSKDFHQRMVAGKAHWMGKHRCMQTKHTIVMSMNLGLLTCNTHGSYFPCGCGAERHIWMTAPQ